MTSDTIQPSTNGAAWQPAGRPRVRWAAIAWAIIFGTTAAFLLWIMVSAERRLALVDWLVAQTPATIVINLMLTIGVIFGLLGTATLLKRRTVNASVRAQQAVTTQQPAGDLTTPPH